MSLRVLLADESASIRKVFQMGLQDFGAEVKSVHNGLDVIEVAESFQPHIVFVDILLQKKNGYEVSEEMASHQSLNQVPVVLMWSSFMELDQKKYQACGAQSELEKPFDVENMRELIKSLVKMESESTLSDFLNFPKSLTQEFVEEEKQKQQDLQVSTDIKVSADGFESEQADTPNLDLDMPEEESPESSEEHEASSIFNTQVESDEFQMYEVSSAYSNPQSQNSSKKPEDTMEIPQTPDLDEEQWQTQPLQDQKLTQTEKTEPDDDLDQFQSMDLGQEKKLNLDDFLYKPETNTAPPLPENTNPNSTGITNQISQVRITGSESDSYTGHNHGAISAAEAEAIIRSETRAAIREVIGKQLPSIMEKVIKNELEKIIEQEMSLKGINSNP